MLTGESAAQSGQKSAARKLPKFAKVCQSLARPENELDVEAGRNNARTLPKPKQPRPENELDVEASGNKARTLP